MTKGDPSSLSHLPCIDPSVYLLPKTQNPNDFECPINSDGCARLMEASCDELLRNSGPENARCERVGKCYTTLNLMMNVCEKEGCRPTDVPKLYERLRTCACGNPYSNNAVFIAVTCALSFVVIASIVAIAVGVRRTRNVDSLASSED